MQFTLCLFAGFVEKKLKGTRYQIKQNQLFSHFKKRSCTSIILLFLHNWARDPIQMIAPVQCYANSGTIILLMSPHLCIKTEQTIIIMDFFSWNSLLIAADCPRVVTLGVQVVSNFPLFLSAKTFEEVLFKIKSDPLTCRNGYD